VCKTNVQMEEYREREERARERDREKKRESAHEKYIYIYISMDMCIYVCVCAGGRADAGVAARYDAHTCHATSPSTTRRNPRWR